MMLTEQVFAQAAALTGELEQQQADLLRLLCGASVSSLRARLRSGIAVEDCQTDLIRAACLYALAAWQDADKNGTVQEFKAGDLTVKEESGTREAASRSLRQQAEALMAPYLRDCFVFTGV